MLVRGWRLFAAALAAVVLGAVAVPAQAADQFYLYDSPIFGFWGDGWWPGTDNCPPTGAEQMLCLGPDSACGAMGLPGTCYAFADLPDSCRDGAYPAGDWTFDLYISGPDTIAVTAAIVSAGCDTLCGALIEHGSAQVVVPPGHCVRAVFTLSAEDVVLGRSRRIGMRLSHQNVEFRSALCWGDQCRSSFVAPAGRLCATAIREATWGMVKARYR
jgi:hypothetical protein